MSEGLPKICRVVPTAKGRDDSGWYAVNHVDVNYVRPEFRRPGGGVTSDCLTSSLSDCIKRCIEYAENRIASAERVKEELISALAEVEGEG